MTTEQRNELLAELRAGFEMGAQRAPSWADVAFLLAELDAAQKRETKLREALTKTTANLRHAYANLFSAAMSADDTRRFADGLIAPEIRRLEAALAEGEER